MTTTPKTVIHVGPGKTATSFLQAQVFRAHSEINYLGKNHPDRDLNGLLSGMVRYDSLRFPEDRAKAAFAAQIAAHPEKKVHLLSEELLGTWRFTDAQLLAVRLREVFGPATILLAVRNTVDWLQSIYFWCLEQGKFGTEEMEFDAWVRHWIAQPPLGNPLSALYTRRLVEVYASAFGAENVKVIVYEDLKKNAQQFAAFLAETIGVDGAEMARIFDAASKRKGEKSRISQDDAAYFKKFSLIKHGDTASLAAFLRSHLDTYALPADREALAPRVAVLADGGLPDPAEQYVLFKAVYKHTKRRMPEGPRAASKLSGATQKMLVNRIGPQLQWVHDEWGVDLAARGYAVKTRKLLGRWL